MSFQYLNYLTSVSNTITYYPILVALPIGLVGNAFAFFIYTRPNLNRKTNTGFLYSILCVLNLIFMLYIVFVFRSPNLFNYTVTLPCGLLQYLLRVAFCFVPWMQVVISFDRFIAVVYPHKKHIMAKKWVLCLIMLGTLVLIGVANIANLLQYTVTYFGWFTFCTMTSQVTVAGNILAILFRAYIPFGLMLALDIIVFKRLRTSKRRVGVIQMGQRKQPGEVSNREYNFIISTILIDLTFVLFYTPVSIYISITVVDVYVNWDPLFSKALDVFYSCALLTVYLYSVVLLFIFFILNRYFRNEVFTLLRLNKLFSSLNNNPTLMMETASTLNMNRTMN